MRPLRILAAAGVLVAGACSTTGGPTVVEAGPPERGAPAGAAMLQQAAQATGDASTGRFTCSASSGDIFSLEVEGSFDLDRGALHSVSSGDFDLGGLGQEGAGSGDTELIVVDDVLYMRNGALELLQASTEWVSVGPEGLGGLYDFGEGGPGLGLGAPDPAQVIDTLREYAGEVTVVGVEEVNGVSTTHVQAEFDLAGLGRHLPQEALDAIEEHGLDELDIEMPLEIWIGEDGIIRRYSLAANVAQLRSASTCDLFDVGEPVTIEAPPASQVTPLGD